MESILKNLFHIVDVEVSWMYAILDKPDFTPEFSDYPSIQHIIRFSEAYRPEVESVVFIFPAQPNKSLSKRLGQKIPIHKVTF